MKVENIFRLIVVLFFLYNTTISVGQGVILDDESIEWVKSLSKPKPSRGIAPPFASLEMYTPTALDQTGTSMCASFALSTIRTIIYARNNNITDIEEIDKNRFSPTFLYYLFKQENDIFCDRGLKSIYAIVYMSEYGLPFSSEVENNFYHPFSDTMICDCYPDNYSDLFSDIKKGSRYPINIESFRLGDFGSENKFKVNHELLKIELSKGNPCFISGSFDRDGQPVIQEGKMGHAMVIIGYDNDYSNGSGAYQIINSYGTNWKDNGKTWIKYEDLETLDGGYIISISGHDNSKELKNEDINLFLSKGLHKSYYETGEIKLELSWKLERELNFKDDCEEEIIVDEPIESSLEELMNECKMQHQEISSEVQIDTFCNCYIISLAVELMVAQALNADIQPERLEEIYNECYLKSILSGCIFGDCINSYSTWVFQNGDVYIGQWKDGKMHGIGSMKYMDESQHIGKWKNGKKHGNFEFFNQSGKSRKEKWKNDKRVK